MNDIEQMYACKPYILLLLVKEAWGVFACKNTPGAFDSFAKEFFGVFFAEKHPKNQITNYRTISVNSLFCEKVKKTANLEAVFRKIVSPCPYTFVFFHYEFRFLAFYVFAFTKSRTYP